MSNSGKIKESFPFDSLFIQKDKRNRRWAIPYHYDALNGRVENLIVNNLYAVKGKRILDLGCHFGTFSYACLNYDAAFVHGVDAESGLISTAYELFNYYNVNKNKYSFTERDVLSFLKEQDDNSFDTILCLGLLYYITDTFHLLEEMKRVASGYIILDTFTAYYAPCVSKAGEKIYKGTKDETFDLPIVIHQLTRADKRDYLLRKNIAKDGNKLISILTLPTIPVLEIFFDMLDARYKKLEWNKYIINNYTWKDFISNEVKKTSHWADVYHSEIRVSYIIFLKD